jgi:Putative zinc-finger
MSESANGSGRGNGHGEANRSKLRPHEEFLELCAIATTGELSEEELRELREHLLECSECREAVREFQAAAEVAAPLLASGLLDSSPPVPTGVDDGAANPAEVAEQMLAGNFASVSGNQEVAAERGKETGRSSTLPHDRGGNARRLRLNWNYVWMPFAAAVMLAVALGLYSYQAGKRRASEPARRTATNAALVSKVDALERQLSDAGHEREVLSAALADRDRLIRDLRRQVRADSASLAQAAHAQAQLQASLASTLDNSKQLAQQQASASAALAAARQSLERTQAKLSSIEQQQQQKQEASASLEAQIEDLNGELRRTQQVVNKQQDLLAEDRDVRDLMGARDLYIAEVYDVGRDGTTRKPYGRVFYTKGKSLIFYAYDLDEQARARQASTFQAWGQHGPNREHALNLGIFYEDSVAKKRWVLKFDNPQALAQINAVFVTVEPRGGSHKPSGKPLLFASLRIEANHP